MHLDRLRTMSSHEWRWRVQDSLRTVAERVRTGAAATRWKRRDIGRLLTTSTHDVCADAINRGHWRGVHDALASHVMARRSRFVLDHSSAAPVREQVLARWPAALHDATSRAERLLEGDYDILGYSGIRCARGGQVDWHFDPIHGRGAPRIFYADVPFLSPEIGDHKVIWELNRHQHWLQLGRAAWLTGDARYAQAIAAQLDSWLADNPPFIGVNWASMLEIGLRAISWTWALHCLLGTPHFQRPTPNEERCAGNREWGVGSSPWLVDMLVALDRQLTHVERHLSYYFSPNTHLTGEALALYVVGTALPELAASARWTETGRRVLLDEIDRQILDDGGHVERSTHYQRYTLDFYLLAALTARLAGDDLAARRFETAALRLADFTRAIADVNGRLPLIGDDDGGLLWPIAGRACDDVRDSLGVAAIVLNKPELAAWGMTEEAVWIAGPRAEVLQISPPTPDRSRLLRDTGYFVARGADDSHAVLDAGPHGYRNGGHAHADALSLTLSVEGHRLLIDPGTCTYTMDSAVRDRMRSTASHNTVTLDERSQSVPDGPFHWRSMVDAGVVVCRCNPAFDVIEAAHDGYAPIRHRRTVVRTADAGWLVVDAIAGSNRRHSAAAHWHFDPAWRITEAEQRLHATHIDGGSAWMLWAGGTASLFRGDVQGTGWCAPVYGQLVPTSTIRIVTESDAPFALVTWIGSGRAFSSPVLRCSQMNELDDPTVIVEVMDGPRSAVFLVRTSDSSLPRRVCRVGEFETDAAMFHCIVDDGQLRSLSMVDGQHVITARERWLSLAADAPMADLHVTIKEDELSLESAVPAGALTVFATSRWTAIRANGCDLPLCSKPVTDTLLIRESDWPRFSSGNPTADPAAHSGAAFARQ